MSKPRYAVLIDGGFLIKNLQNRNKHFPTIAEVNAECDRIRAHDALKNSDLLRVYFYHAQPATKQISNPLSGKKLNLAQTDIAKNNQSLQQSLEMQGDFALRMGDLATHGWKLGGGALRRMKKSNTNTVSDSDLVPNIEQKGVDLRIGLDIARLSLRGLVQTIVVVTGDSDFVPAFKFARREGIRVYLDHLGHGVMRELKVHTDLVL